VKLQGQTVLSRLDIAAEAGGRNRALAKQIADVSVKGTMTVEFVPVRGKPPVICALEIVER
jgi:hypothetical protein